MANYEYIIASLPLLSQDGKSVSGIPEAQILQEIQEQLSKRDTATLALLQEGWKEDALCVDFYKKALASSNSFIREYFAFDLMARNAKVAYLNKALSRPAGQNVIDVEGFEADSEQLEHIQSVLAGNDLLQRERGIDDAYWKFIDETVIMDVFTLNQVLAFVAKLHIVERWLQLDEATGRQMFRQLVDEVRGTFSGVNYNA